MKTLLSLMIVLTSWSVQADPKSTHGMLLFGNNSTYASHLPMFHAPHDYQLVTRVVMNDVSQSLNGSGPMAKYNALKKQGHELFTLMPEPFDLTKVISGEIQSYKAELFDGHFERGGTSLGVVNVAVKQIIVSSKLNPKAKETNQYLVFGSIGDHYAVHLIGGKPNYDAVVAVTVSEKSREKGTDVNPIIVSRLESNQDADPKAGEILEGSVSSDATQIKNVIYFEKDELSH